MQTKLKSLILLSALTLVTSSTFALNARLRPIEAPKQTTKWWQKAKPIEVKTRATQKEIMEVQDLLIKFTNLTEAEAAIFLEPFRQVSPELATMVLNFRQELLVRRQDRAPLMWHEMTLTVLNGMVREISNKMVTEKIDIAYLISEQ
jgi:hypothetical protein